MALIDLFRRPKPIADLAALEEFVGRETAFLTQKTIWEYSRARSGVLWQKLFKEEAFKAAIERSCWRNFPLGLAFVSEMVAGTLRGHAGADPADAVAAARTVARRVIAAQPQPRDFEDAFWAEAADFVDLRLNRTLVAPPKAVKDIPLDGHRLFFDQLPMHPDLTRHDGLLLQNSLRIHLCRAHETLLSRLDRTALSAGIRGSGSP